MKKVLIIPDSNYLHVNFKKKADFREFTFNDRFKELISFIESNNLEDRCVIGLSKVVLEELLMQKYEAYNDKTHELKSLMSNYTFPSIHLNSDEVNENDYYDFLKNKRNEYIDHIKSKIISYIDIDIPHQIRFKSIINRAFNKRAPFEGKKGKSDKGFKDALFWESILDLDLDNNYSDIIVVTSDKRLINEDLLEEYKNTTNNISLNIIPGEEIIDYLKEISFEHYGLADDATFANHINKFLSHNSEWKEELIQNIYEMYDYKKYEIYDFELNDYEELDNNRYLVILDVIIKCLNETNHQILKYSWNIITKFENDYWFYIDFEEPEDGVNNG